MQSRNLVWLHLRDTTPRRTKTIWLTSKKIAFISIFLLAIAGVLSV